MPEPRIQDRSPEYRRLASLSPALAEFVAVLDDTVDRRRPDTFWACAPAFGALLRSHVVAALVNAELDAAVADPRHVPTDLTADGQWCVLRAAGCALVASVVVGRPGVTNRSLTNVEHCLVGVVSGTPLPCRVFRPADGTGPDADTPPLDVFDPERRLGPPRSVTVAPGTVLPVHAGLDVVQLAAEPGATTVVLKLLSWPIAPLMQEYDLVTGRPRRLIAGSATPSRLEYLCRILAAMERTEALPVLEDMARSHGAHAVRWAALRAVAQLDPASGRRLLAAAVDDRHPSVRAAARTALARTGDDEPVAQPVAAAIR